MLPSSRGQLRPPEGAGPLPALLLDFLSYAPIVEDAKRGSTRLGGNRSVDALECSKQGRKVCLRREEFLMRSEEARIGAKVMVDEAGHGSEWRGLAGTIIGKWGHPEYLALDVLLDDGRTQLFWHHEVDEIDARGA